jgi:Bacterial PH domain
MKTYKANRKGILSYAMIGLVLSLIGIGFLKKNILFHPPLTGLTLLISILTLLWIYVDTSYCIDNDILSYRSGFLRGSVDIKSIQEITKGKTSWIGIKPALAQKGLIIKYNKYDEIYLAPVNNDDMIADILRINPTINILT